MSRSLRITFLIHTIVSVVFGILLLVIPGRFLQAFAWAPIDPIISRLLGAALLAMAWGSFRGWRAVDRAAVVIVVEIDAIFTILAALGLLRHLLVATWPLMVWVLFAILVAFAIAWIVALIRK